MRKPERIPGGAPARTVTKHYAWDWEPLPDAKGAAWSEEWTYSADGALLSHRRTRQGQGPTRTTISTDPRAGAIMREELARHGHSFPRAATGQMAGPHGH